jgi:hypothetical protein
MKPSFACFAFLLFCVLVQFCFSQQIEPKPVLIDEVEGRLCGDPWKARLDNFAVALSNEPNSRGYIILYGTADESENQQFLIFFKTYLSLVRDISKDRLIVLRGNSGEKMRVQLWFVPIGAEVKPSEQYKPVTFSQPTILRTVWYDDKGSYFNDGGGLMNDACAAFSVSGFANILKENSNLLGYLVIFTDFRRGANKADKAARYALRDLRKFKAPMNRIKTFYGGNRREAEIEFWLVPEGQKLPKAALDKRKAS